MSFQNNREKNNWIVLDENSFLKLERGEVIVQPFFNSWFRTTNYLIDPISKERNSSVSNFNFSTCTLHLSNLIQLKHPQNTSYNEIVELIIRKFNTKLANNEEPNTMFFRILYIGCHLIKGPHNFFIFLYGPHIYMHYYGCTLEKKTKWN